MEYKQMLIDKFKDSGWYNILKGFLLSEEFDKILYYLKDRWEKENEAFTPPLSKILRAFEECPFENLKVVVIGQD